MSWYIILQIFVCSMFIHSFHQSIRIKKKLKTDHAMHSQKYFILGDAMVDKNLCFSDPGSSNQSELVHQTTNLCVQYVHWFQPSINQNLKKNINLQGYAITKIFNFRWCHMDKNHFFRIQNQVTKVRWYIILQIFVRSMFIDSIHQSIRIFKKIKTYKTMQ